jgi:hypothetical protein
MDPGPISILLLSPVYFTRILYYFPLDTLITFVSSKPVRLTTSSQVGNKVLGCVCAGSTLPLVKQSLDEAPYKLFVAVAKLASITFSRLCLLSWSINLGFLTEGKSCCYIHHTFLLGFPTGYTLAIKRFSGAVAGEEVEDFCEGSFSHTHPLLCYCFALPYLFYLHRFYQKCKKLESLVVVISCV